MKKSLILLFSFLLFGSAFAETGYLYVPAKEYDVFFINPHSMKDNVPYDLTCTSSSPNDSNELLGVAQGLTMAGITTSEDEIVFHKLKTTPEKPTYTAVHIFNRDSIGNVLACTLAPSPKS